MHRKYTSTHGTAMRTCIFQLYGPMVSWGEIAVGGTRRSALHPSRSAILGIVAAALGIKREAEEVLDELGRSLSIAARVDAPGTLLTDFHTIQVPKQDRRASYLTRKEEMNAPSEKIGTILSSREYRCDAYSLIAICLRDGRMTLQQIVEALRNPTFHIFLGRKSSPPALPLYPQIVQADDLVEAFSKAQFPDSLPVDDRTPPWRIASFKKHSQNVLRGTQRHYYWETGMVPGIEPLQKSTPYDDPISRSRWQFGMRDEYMAIERTLHKQEEAPDVHQQNPG